MSKNQIILQFLNISTCSTQHWIPIETKRKFDLCQKIMGSEKVFH